MAQTAPGGTVRVLSTFRNDGLTLASPRGVATVTAADGSEIGRFPIEQGNTLPGSSRQLIAEWAPDGLTVGSYSVLSEVTLGGRTLTHSGTFSVVARDEVALERVQVAEMRPLRAMSGLPILLSFELTNVGNVQVTSDLAVSVFDVSGAEVAAPAVSAVSMEPGASIATDDLLEEGLPVGRYRVVVAATSPSGMSESREWVLDVVEGERVVSLEVTEFAIPTVKVGVGVVPRVAVVNSGNTPVELSGYIEIQDMAGKVVGMAPITGRGVAPGTTDALDIAASEPLPAGVYKAVLNLDYAGKRASVETMLLITK